jgi:hypothetical protein
MSACSAAACITVTNARQRNAMPADAFLANDRYASFKLSLRHLVIMMADRGIR